MPRYIDAEKLIQHLKDEIEGCTAPIGYSRAYGKTLAIGTGMGLKMAISFAETLPNEEVAPRAEVDALKLEVENEILKRERQREILNHYALQYGTVKSQQEVIDKIKRETVKEFARRVKATFPPREDPHCTDDDIFTLDSIDTIMNDMLSVLKGENK